LTEAFWQGADSHAGAGDPGTEAQGRGTASTDPDSATFFTEWQLEPADERSEVPD
jgi:hypothetical protein